jgi:hypothetical protein
MADGWELFYFQTLEVDPLADLDQDGICNCIEFLYGTSPAQPSTSPLQISIVNSEGQSKLRLLFPRRLGLSPLPYYYESSTDLVDWTVPANLTETTVATDEIEGVPVEWVQVLLPAPTDTGFVRSRSDANMVGADFSPCTASDDPPRVAERRQHRPGC